MIDKDFIRDFFGVRRQRTEAYRWTMAREFMAVTDSQHPNYPRELFKQWTAEGWEVVSVTPQVNAPHGEVHYAWAIGVLRKPMPDESRP